VFPVKYKLGFYIPEDDIVHSLCSIFSSPFLRPRSEDGSVSIILVEDGRSTPSVDNTYNCDQEE
jgi:hypothetical protein